MEADSEPLPDDIDALKAALTIERTRLQDVVAQRDAGAAELAVLRARASEDLALIAHQKLRIAKLEHQIYGPRSERSERLIDQLALQFEELQASATDDELAAEVAVSKTTTVAGFTRKRAVRTTFPEHLPRERVVIDAPAACACCGGTRLRKLGEDVTRTLETIPRQCAGEIHLPGLREDQPGAGPLPCDCQGMGGTQPAGDDPVRKIRPASAIEPAGRALRSGRRADQPVDPGRRRGLGLCGARSVAATD
jgi:hypothetical protein